MTILLHVNNPLLFSFHSSLTLRFYKPTLQKNNVFPPVFFLKLQTTDSNPRTKTCAFAHPLSRGSKAPRAPSRPCASTVWWSAGAASATAATARRCRRSSRTCASELVFFFGGGEGKKYNKSYMNEEGWFDKFIWSCKRGGMGCA